MTRSCHAAEWGVCNLHLSVAMFQDMDDSQFNDKRQRLNAGIP